MEELPFECEVTAAARPGKANQLAIRITNPGGRLDWVDGGRITWGDATFQKSHGFGGLDRALTLTAHGPARIRDAWVLNTPQLRRITAHAEIENTGPTATDARLRFAVVDPVTSRELAHTEVSAPLNQNQIATFQAELSCPSAQLWDLDSPHLYRLKAEWLSASSGEAHASTSSAGSMPITRTVDFGFRWFAPEGVGTNALFRLNGRRVRIYTAISWGYWALNGLFPTPELAEKEVMVAQQFHLNCLNFHRNLAKEEVLAIQDRGASCAASSPAADTRPSAQPAHSPASPNATCRPRSSA